MVHTGGRSLGGGAFQEVGWRNSIRGGRSRRQPQARRLARARRWQAVGQVGVGAGVIQIRLGLEHWRPASGVQGFAGWPGVGLAGGKIALRSTLLIFSSRPRTRAFNRLVGKYRKVGKQSWMYNFVLSLVRLSSQGGQGCDQSWTGS